MQRFFFKYPKTMISYWYFQKYLNKNDSYLRISNQKPTRWDLWQLQKQMKYSDILNHG